MPTNLFDNTMQGLATALGIHQRRHQVLASNVANVETPAYRAKEIDFGNLLQAAFTEPVVEGAPPPSGTVRDDPHAPMRRDGNSVDVDLQMAKLASNTGRYNTLAKILSKRFQLLRQAIDGVR